MIVSSRHYGADREAVEGLSLPPKDAQPLHVVSQKRLAVEGTASLYIPRCLGSLVQSDQQRKAAYKISEAAELLSISVSQFYRLMELGQIDTIKIGGCRRVTWHQIECFLRKQEGQGSPAKRAY